MVPCGGRSGPLSRRGYGISCGRGAAVESKKLIKRIIRRRKNIEEGRGKKGKVEIKTYRG